MICPFCQKSASITKSTLSTVNITKGVLVCYDKEHTFAYNTNHNTWFLKVPTHNTWAYAGFDGETPNPYFTMVVKGAGATPIINRIKPFNIEDTNKILQKFIKLLNFL